MNKYRGEICCSQNVAFWGFSKLTVNRLIITSICEDEQKLCCVTAPSIYNEGTRFSMFLLSCHLVNFQIMFPYCMLNTPCSCEGRPSHNQEFVVVAWTDTKNNQYLLLTMFFPCNSFRGFQNLDKRVESQMDTAALAVLWTCNSRMMLYGRSVFSERKALGLAFVPTQDTRMRISCVGSSYVLENTILTHWWIHYLASSSCYFTS